MTAGEYVLAIDGDRQGAGEGDKQLNEIIARQVPVIERDVILIAHLDDRRIGPADQALAPAGQAVDQQSSEPLCGAIRRFLRRDQAAKVRRRDVGKHRLTALRQALRRPKTQDRRQDRRA